MPLKILIVDDEQNIRKSLTGLLKDHNYPSSSCESGEQAIQLISQQNYDLVFLDVKLPGIDGLQVNRQHFFAWLKVHFEILRYLLVLKA